jgi:hypothetical protein
MLKSLATWLLMAAMMFGLAYLFICGWDRQEFVDQARRANVLTGRMEP